MAEEVEWARGHLLYQPRHGSHFINTTQTTASASEAGSGSCCH